MPHTKLLLKDFYAVPAVLKAKDDITDYRLQKLKDYFEYIAENKILCNVNKLIITQLNFYGYEEFPARLCDFYAYFGEFKLIEYLINFHSAIIDQKIIDCAIFGGDQQTIQFLHKIQPGLISDISLITLPILENSLFYVVGKLDLSGYLQVRRVNKRFSTYREVLIDHLRLQLQSPRVFDCVKALKGLIHITRQLTGEDKQKIAERINKINFDRTTKKSFHFEDNPEKIITYDNKSKLLTEYLNLPTDDEIPSEPQEEHRSFVPSHIIKHLYLKLLHQLGCIPKYYEVFYDSLDEQDLTVPDKLRFTLLSMRQCGELDRSGNAVVDSQAEITQLQQEIQNRLYSNHYTDDESGIEKQKSDIQNLVIVLYSGFKDQHDKCCIINLIEYLINILLSANKLASVDFCFKQLSHLLPLISNEQLLTIVWPKFERVLMLSLQAWPFVIVGKLKEQENKERNIHYAHGLIRLFFDVFLPKLSQLQIQQLISEISRFKSPERENLALYLSVALMVYWEPHNNTQKKLASIARKIFCILKLHKDSCYLEPLINSDLILNIIFYRLSLKNRLNQIVPYLLKCLDYSDKMIEVTLQLINLIIKYSTKKERICYFTAHEQADFQAANLFIATISNYYADANGLDYEGGANAHIIEDIRFENEFLFTLLPSDVLADEALYSIWTKMLDLSDSEFSTEISTLLAKFGLRFSTSIIIRFLAEKIDIIFDKLLNIINDLSKGAVTYHVFHIIDLILLRLSRGEVNHQNFINLIKMLVRKALSSNDGNFKLTIIVRLFPFVSASSQLRDYILKYILKYIAIYSAKLNEIDKKTVPIGFSKIREIMNSLAILAPCLSESDHALLEAVCKLGKIVVQNISGNIFTLSQSQVLLTQFYTLLSANLHSKNKADLFQLVCELFLSVIEQYRRNFKDNRDFHKDYANTIYLFLDLLDNSNDVECFKKYLLPVLPKLFKYLQDDLTEFLYLKLHNSKLMQTDKKIGYNLLFTMVEFHQALHDLLLSVPKITTQQLLFCFMLMDFDKTRCKDLLGLKDGDKAVGILDILAENHVSLIANSKPTQQITDGNSQAVADEPMRVDPQSVAMLIDSGNSIFSGATKRSAVSDGAKDLKIQRTDSPPRPR